jgi:NhaP-type Na+/H+ or K+/H+ antiporter
MPTTMTAFVLFAIVLIVAPLASGLVQRAPISFPMIFLGMGILLGERGLNVLSLSPHDKSLEVVGTLTLALVLFIDAVKLRIDEVGENWLVPALTLGPGALVTIAIVAFASWMILDFSPVTSILMGAILASTDPVVLRDLLRDSRIPRSIRRTLGIEAGTNDIVVLPTVLILIAVANSDVSGVLSWAGFFVRILVLGPLAGAVVGAAGAWTMSKINARYHIDLQYQALYGIGLVLACYVVGVGVGGDGFLAAFAGGFAVTALNFELCDCFIDYGEVTAEMAMFLAFVLFGAVVSTITYDFTVVRMVLFALVVIVVARPIAMALVLRHASVSSAARRTIGWFGPRGLSSLLFALLVIESGFGDSEAMMGVVGIVVTISVIAHGASAAPLASWYSRRAHAVTLAEEREATSAGLFRDDADEHEVPRVSVEELAQLLDSEDPPILLDVRTRSQFDRDQERIPGSIRVVPDQIIEWINAQQDRDRLVVAYCT